MHKKMGPALWGTALLVMAGGAGCATAPPAGNTGVAPTSGPVGEARLIVMADDIGVSHGVNVATFEAHERGIVTTTNVIVPGGWFPEVVQLASEHADLDVGVHIALTSEWDKVRWRPLTHAPSLVDDMGFFPPMVGPQKSRAGVANLVDMHPDIGEVETELRAQIEMARKYIPRVSYLWAHMGFTGYAEEARALVLRLAEEYGIPLFNEVIEGLGVQWLKAGYDKLDSGDVKAAKLVAAIDALGAGTFVMVDHAATDSPESRAMGHPGYQEVAQDRAANLAMWTHPLVKEAIQRRGVKLISAADAVAEWKNKQAQ